MNRVATIIGCGSTGMATAAYLSQQGHSITLCDTEAQSEDFDFIRQEGGIRLEGAISSDKPIPLACLSNDFATSVGDAEIVLLCISTGRHKEITERILPYVHNGQTILFVPGNMGSILLKRDLKLLGKGDVVVAEMSGNLWACRRTAPGQVLIALPPSPKKVAALPAADTLKAVETLSDLMKVEAATNILETTLNSPNVVSHVGGSLLNAVQIERKGDEFALFEDGLSEAFIRCAKGIEQERNEVLKALNLQIYGESGEGLFRTLMNGNTPPHLADFRALKGPSSLSHRYVSEDAGCGVALLISLGQEYGIPTPLSDSFLKIAGYINNTDYIEKGYTLKNLGLSGLPPEALNQSLEGSVN